jgi:hypothetical protein
MYSRRSVLLRREDSICYPNSGILLAACDHSGGALYLRFAAWHRAVRWVTSASAHRTRNQRSATRSGQAAVSLDGEVLTGTTEDQQELSMEALEVHMEHACGARAGGRRDYEPRRRRYRAADPAVTWGSSAVLGRSQEELRGDRIPL